MRASAASDCAARRNRDARATRAATSSTLSSVAEKGAPKESRDVVAYDFTRQSVVAVFRGPENSAVTQVAVSRDGRVLAAGTRDGTVLIWDVTGK